MRCLKCGSKIPPNSRKSKYCSERCGRLYLKSIYRKRYQQERRELLEKKEKRNRLTCMVCGGNIPSVSKSKLYCSEFCAVKNHKRVYYRKHRESVLAYNREFNKLKANKKLEKVFKKEECYFCGSQSGLVWHHAEYNPVQKLVRMCEYCHRKLHELLRYRNTSGKTPLN